MQRDMKKALGPLLPLYENEEVRSIFVDAPEKVYVEKGNGVESTDVTLSSEADLEELVEGLFALVGRTKSTLGSYADARLGDGTSIRAMFPPVSLGGPALVIEKMMVDRPTWKDLLTWGCLDVNGLEVVDALLKTNRTVLVAGNYGSGKTTLTSLIIDRLPEEKRVIVAEHNAEVSLERNRAIRLETTADVNMDELLIKANKLRPDCLVVNELLGSETKVALELMRSGTPVIATVNAGDLLDALSRVEQMALSASLSFGLTEVRSIVSSAMNYVVYIEKMKNGVRRVLEISELTGLDEGRYRIRPLYRYDVESDKFIVTNRGKELLASFSS